MSDANLEYGFRYDPTLFVENDATLQGALVRTFVFEQPQPGDDTLVQGRIDELLAEQRDDGSFGDTAKATGSCLLDLLKLGLPHDRPEVAHAVEAILAQNRAGKMGDEGDLELAGGMSVYPAHALALLGRSDLEEVVQWYQWAVDHPQAYLGMDKGCPWCPNVLVQALWVGRNIVDTKNALDASFTWLRDNLNEAGALGWKDPMGVLDCAGYADHPTAGEVVREQLPLILRMQRPDGGWGDKSLIVFRALRQYGLLEELDGKPPLPADFRITRSVPIPANDVFSLAWDGQQFWTFDKNAGAVAFSREDGSVTQHVAVPDADVHGGVGWWNESLAVTLQKPEKRLVLLDPATGALKQDVPLDKWQWPAGVSLVGDKVVVADGFLCCIGLLNAEDLSMDRLGALSGPGPVDLAGQGETVWSSDWMAGGVLFHSTLDGQLLDWGSVPFGGRIAGVAHDGEYLWVIDEANHRICALEMTEAMKERSRDPVKRGTDSSGLSGLTEKGRAQ